MRPRAFVGGIVRTLDPTLPVADFVVVRDGRISSVGRVSDLDREFDGVVVDLEGKTVLPGFVDAHLHFTQMVWEIELTNLSGIGSLDALRQKLEATRRTKGSGGWLIGRRMRGSLLLEMMRTGGRILGDCAGRDPAILGTEDMHSAVVNVRGWDILTREGGLETVPEKLLERKEDVVILKKDAAFAAWRTIEEKEKKVDEEAMGGGVERLHSRGVTGIFTFERLSDCRMIKESRACNRGLKIAAGIYPDDLETLPEIDLKAEGEGFSLIGLKVFIDGSLGSRTALMLDPYDDVEGCGIEATALSWVRNLAIRGVENGLGICFHAIGDRAVRVALDVWEEISGAAGPISPVSRVEHIQLVHPDDLGRFHETGAFASIQPLHLIADSRAAEKAWGGRCKRSYPMRSLLESGARVAFGSDAPVVNVDPLGTVRVAVNRKTRPEDPDEDAWFPDEGMSIEDALRSHTVEAACSSGWEGVAGQIREGYCADMVILSRDPFASEEDFAKTEVVATVVDGRFVYGKDRVKRMEPL